MAPRSPTEELLAGIWSSVLAVERIGIHDNFFELGGHSLLAMQVASRIQDAFGIRESIRLIFEYPVLVDLAMFIEEAIGRGEQGRQAPPIGCVPRDGDLALSFGQQRLWIVDQLGAGAAYNMAAALILRGGVDGEALERAISEIVRRHEVLQTTFPIVNGSPVQKIAPFEAVRVARIDLRMRPEQEQAEERRRLATEEAHRPFDLSRGPLLRVSLLLGSESDVLLVTVHHIVADGWSMGILIRELTALYEAFLSGGSSPLPELAIQYADFAHWQRQWMSAGVLEEQLTYWRRQLAGVAPLLNLPTHHPRPQMQSFRGGTERFELEGALTRELKLLSRREGATLFMTLLAAFVTLLSRYSGQEDIVVGSPMAGRNRAETEPLIGFFVNTLALRIDLSGNPGFRELLEQVRRVTLEAYTHQDVPFEQVVEDLMPGRSLNHSPLFQVMFVFQSAPAGRLGAARPVAQSPGSGKCHGEI